MAWHNCVLPVSLGVTHLHDIMILSASPLSNHVTSGLHRCLASDL